MAVVVYIAVSVDGFIAPADGSIDWLAPYETVDYGYDAFIASVGTVVMGRITYEQSRSFGDWPYWGKQVIVLSSRPAPADALPDLTFTADVPALIADARQRPDGDVWLAGGTGVIQAFLRAGAVDEMRLYLIPTLLGAGRRLFGPIPPAGLTLAGTEVFPNGVVGLTYRLSR